MKKFLIYTDGSYCKGHKDTHGGIVYVPVNDEMELKRIHVFTTQPELVRSWNVGGECLAAWCALLSVVSEVKRLNKECMDTYECDIVYDYEGVGGWPTLAWKRREKPVAQWYYGAVTNLLKQVPNLKVNWRWVKAHTGRDPWNAEADAVAAYNMEHCEINNIPICDMDETLKEMFFGS